MSGKIQRPLFLYSCVFIALCALFFLLPVYVCAVLFLACLCTALFLFFTKRISFTLLLALLFAVIYPFVSSLCLHLPEMFATDEVGAVYEGTVQKSRDYGNVQRYTLRIKSTKYDSFPFPIKVYYDSEGLCKGDKIEFFARIGKNEEDTSYVYSYGTRLYAYDVEAVKLSPCKSTALSEFHTFAKQVIYSNLPESQRHISFPLAKAIFLGDKQSLTNSLYESFSKSGISHIFCVSGLHLTLVVSFLFSLLGIFFIPARAKSCICIFVTLLYMATVGFTPSVVRSGVMMILFLSSHLLRNQPDSLTSLGFAGFVLCIFSPTSVFDIGAQLSFLATLGLICSSYFSQAFLDFKLHFLPKFILNCLLSTVFATAFCLPCTVFLFGRISLVSYIANLFVIYPATLALLLLLLIVLLSPLSFLSPVSAFFGKCASFLLVLTQNLSDTFRKIPFSSIPASAGPFMFLTFFLLLFALVIILSQNKKKLCAIFMCSVLVLNFITVCAYAFSYFNSLYSFDTGIYTDTNSTLLCAKDGGTYVICDISCKEQKQSTKCFFYGENALDFSEDVFDSHYGKNVYFIPISQNLCENTVISNLKAVQKYSGISLCILSGENENTALARRIRAVLDELQIPYTAQNEFSFGSAVIIHEDDGVLRVENKDENYVFLYTREYDKRIFEKYRNLAGAVYIPRTAEKEYVLFPNCRFFTEENVQSYKSDGTANTLTQYEYVSLRKQKLASLTVK